MTSDAGDRGRYRLRSRLSKSLRGRPRISRRLADLDAWRERSVRPARDRITPARSERLARDLEAGRHLAALVLAGPHATQNVGDDRGLKAASDERRRVEPLDQMCFQDPVQQIVRRQA